MMSNSESMLTKGAGAGEQDPELENWKSEKCALIIDRTDEDKKSLKPTTTTTPNLIRT